MHLDADENWHAGSDLDIYSVALHEAGHALGLGHSDKPGDVMYPYYRSHMVLSTNDIGALQALYGNAAGAPPAPITFPAPTAPAPLRLTLDSVPASTQISQISVTGTLSGGKAPISLQWQTDHGYSGPATLARAGGSTGPSWSVTAIPLVTGSNTITVTAFDAARQTATQTAMIALTPSPVRGFSAPVSLRITTPSSSVTTLSAPTMSITGTASGGSGIARVTWQTAAGASGTAAGKAQWQAADVPLLGGTNTIVVRAWDTSGATAWCSLIVVRH
jgi:hypothetical protein